MLEKNIRMGSNPLATTAINECQKHHSPLPYAVKLLNPEFCASPRKFTYCEMTVENKGKLKTLHILGVSARYSRDPDLSKKTILILLFAKTIICLLKN